MASISGIQLPIIVCNKLFIRRDRERASQMVSVCQRARETDKLWPLTRYNVRKRESQGIQVREVAERESEREAERESEREAIKDLCDDPGLPVIMNNTPEDNNLTN